VNLGIDQVWDAVYKQTELGTHNFSNNQFEISNNQIAPIARNLGVTSTIDLNRLCNHSTRDQRPSIFISHGLFILPIAGQRHASVKGEGFIDIPRIEQPIIQHHSMISFSLDTLWGSHTNTQQLDLAYASSILRTFVEDKSIVLTRRGRGYTPRFSFHVGKSKIEANSIPTWINAGYEGRHSVFLLVAKKTRENVPIKRIYYPYRQWQSVTQKRVFPVLFEQAHGEIRLWQYVFPNQYDYNSIKLVRKGRFAL